MAAPTLPKVTRLETCSRDNDVVEHIVEFNGGPSSLPTMVLVL